MDPRITAATDLVELRDTLNEIDAECAANGVDPQSVYDCTSLPTFGGIEPRNTEGIWSWDETHDLRHDARWHLEERDAWVNARKNYRDWEAEFLIKVTNEIDSDGDFYIVNHGRRYHILKHPYGYDVYCGEDLLLEDLDLYPAIDFALNGF